MLKNLETQAEKDVRRLVTLAHERGLKQHLEKLDAAFAEWRSGKITALALTDRINAFHDGPSTTMAKQFTPNNSMNALGHAVVSGLVKDAEVPAALKEELSMVVSLLKFKR